MITHRSVKSLINIMRYHVVHWPCPSMHYHLPVVRNRHRDMYTSHGLTRCKSIQQPNETSKSEKKIKKQQQPKYHAVRKINDHQCQEIDMNKMEDQRPKENHSSQSKSQRIENAHSSHRFFVCIISIIEQAIYSVYGHNDKYLWHPLQMGIQFVYQACSPGCCCLLQKQAYKCIPMSLT